MVAAAHSIFMSASDDLVSQWSCDFSKIEGIIESLIFEEIALCSATCHWIPDWTRRNQGSKVNFLGSGKPIEICMCQIPDMVQLNYNFTTSRLDTNGSTWTLWVVTVDIALWHLRSKDSRGLYITYNPHCRAISWYSPDHRPGRYHDIALACGQANSPDLW